MAGIYTRGAVDKIIRNADLTEEQKTEQLFSLFGRALDDGYISKSTAEELKTAAVEAAKKDIKIPEPVDVKTSPEYTALAQERDMLRAIGGEDFASVKPKFREQVWGMLSHEKGSKPISEQLTGIKEKYDEYFTPAEPTTPPKPNFGSPDKGTIPSGKQTDADKISEIWGFGPKQ